MAEPARQRATLADLEAVPANLSAELIHGVLYTMARPKPRRQHANVFLSGEVSGPFQRGRGGPGGWWILTEPGVAFPELDVEEISPDLAGWRKERMPELPDARITVVPDWVCEILSPSTRSHDQRIKRPLYARVGVRWMWVVDVDARTVVASRNEAGRWLELGVFVDDDVLRAEPFETHGIELRELWAPR
jgi:Uma2 family endonuclease